MRRWLLTLLSLLALSAGPASASGFLVGADEDGLLWNNSRDTASIVRALGLKAVHVTIPWHAGEPAVPAVYETALSRAATEAWGLRLVVSVYGSPNEAPQTPDAQGQYCDFVGDLLKRNPTINDVAIWNDTNDASFWSPQFAADGSSVAPAAYEALLARCWDTLHAIRPAVNVISVAVSHTTSQAGSFLVGSHSASDWYRLVGEAYRASGRSTPILDTFGEIPHASRSNERPWAKHADSGSIGLGDYARLTSVLQSAFGGTGQPLPGQGPVTVWYLAQAFQSRVDPAKAGLYSGKESEPRVPPALSPLEASDRGKGPAPDQPTQIEDAVRVAYCQPGVGAYFNFHLADEADLAGFQSGVLWADWSPKPSYQALHDVASHVNAGGIDCASFASNGVPPRLPAIAPTDPLRVSGLRVASLSPGTATVAWHTSIPASVQVEFGLPGGAPVLFADPQGSQASLGGLSYGAAYRVWVSAVSPDGQRAQASLDFHSAGPPAVASGSIGRPAGDLLVNGQPFFPMFVWASCPDRYTADVANGINLFGGLDCANLSTAVTGLAGRAFAAGMAGDSSTPGAFGFFYTDEADGQGLVASQLPQPPPGQPTFLTLTNHFYTGAAPLDAGRGIYPAFVARTDMIGFDLFPLQEWCMPNRVGDVYFSQKELVALAPQKPTYQWVEAAEWKCPGGATAVTPATVRAESWLAIAGGAHGLGFFPSSWSVPIGNTISGVTRQIAELGPALLAAPEYGQSDAPLVHVGVRHFGGATYVIAVNSGFGPVNSTITVPGLGGHPLDVVDEGRRLGSVGDSFSDSFDPLGVHIYVAAPA